MIPLVEVKNLHISFSKKKILKGVTFSLTEGECLGLIGGSGEGKSTLLRSLIGLEHPTSGKIFIEGEDVLRSSQAKFIEIRKKVAYAFQGGALFDSMTVLENLLFPLREHSFHSEKKMKQLALQELKEFELEGCENMYPSELSGGMQKRVGIARATITKPKVLLYDEPTSGLDPYKKRNMENTILRLQKKGSSSIMVTHDMQAALKLCDRIALLGEGKIKAIDTPQNFQKSYNKLLNNFIHGIKGGENESD